jgi:hypothetical protein
MEHGGLMRRLLDILGAGVVAACLLSAVTAVKLSADSIVYPKSWTSNEVLTHTDLNAQFNAVTSAVNGNLDNGNLKASAAIVGTKLADAPSGVPTAKINDSAVTTAKIGPGAVTADKMSGYLAALNPALGVSTIGWGNFGLVFEGNVADSFEGTLNAGTLTADRDWTLPNVNGTIVTTGDAGTVTGTMLANATVQTADLATGAVDSVVLQDNSVDTDHIIDGEVDAADIAPGAVGTAELALGAVGTAELALDAVTTSQIAAGTIVDSDVNASANISGTKLADTSVGFTKLGDNSIPSSKIADGAIVNADVNASAAIVGTKLAVGAAVNASTTAEATADNFFTTTEEQMISAAITTRGGKVLVIATISGGATNLIATTGVATARVKRGVGGTLLRTMDQSFPANGTTQHQYPLGMTLVTIDQPAAGTYTYELTIQAQDLSTNSYMSSCSITLLELS